MQDKTVYTISSIIGWLTAAAATGGMAYVFMPIVKDQMEVNNFSKDILDQIENAGGNVTIRLSKGEISQIKQWTRDNPHAAREAIKRAVEKDNFIHR